MAQSSCSWLPLVKGRSEERWSGPSGWGEALAGGACLHEEGGGLGPGAGREHTRHPSSTEGGTEIRCRPRLLYGRGKRATTLHAKDGDQVVPGWPLCAFGGRGTGAVGPGRRSKCHGLGPIKGAGFQPFAFSCPRALPNSRCQPPPSLTVL